MRNKEAQLKSEEKSYGFYNYCIFSVKEWKENPDLLVIELDMPRKDEAFYAKHIKIRKNEVFDFIKAIMPEFDLKTMKRAQELIGKLGLLKVLNASLVGRCFVVKEDIKTYLQYTNGALSPEAITCMDLEGKLYAENGGKYFEKFPRFDEVYPKDKTIE